MIVNTFPKFYQELAHLWSNVSEQAPLTTSEIFEEVLWNNSRIMLNEESIYNYHFISKGISTIRDLIDASGELLGWTEAKQKYHLTLLSLGGGGIHPQLYSPSAMLKR